MVSETSAFLSWALREQSDFRIPRRRVDRGGFAGLMSEPQARASVNQWWMRVLNQEIG